LRIDYANLKIAYQDHQKEFDRAIEKVLTSAHYIMGPEVTELEDKLTQFTQAKHSLSCSSGTDALLLALMAIDVGPGDEIITSPFTFISTAETIALLGATPVFVDIKEDSYNIDASQVEAKINEKTKAILPVSLYGQVADMNELNQIAEKYQLPVIEDAAQSFGASYHGQKSCSLSTLACTSFFPSKPLGCFGDAGAVFTNDSQLSEKMSSLRLHGQSKRYQHKHIGLGARMDTLQAAVLSVKMDYYKDDIANRQQVAEKYNKLLTGHVKTPIIHKFNSSVWAQYSIRLQNRERVQKELSKKEIPTAVHYPQPLHLQDCFTYLGYEKGDFPVSENVSNEIMSLPMNPYLREDEQAYIVKELISCL
jgi:UDP-2-acetamido-2-deoxy-ribo-hexuluronate aminotransferase